MASTRVYVVSLGGLNDVGERNCYAVVCEHDGIRDAVLLDCGQKIPVASEGQPAHLGPEYFPNFEYLARNNIRVHGAFISHGHLDHVGGVKELIENSGVTLSPAFKVYGSAFTVGTLRVMVYKQRGDEVLSRRSSWIYLQTDTVVHCGPFEVRMFAVNHSIPGAMGIHVSVAGKKILYLGDWKLLGPKNSDDFLGRMLGYGEDGVDALLLDATNADKPGITLPEEVATSAIIETMNRHSRGRVLIATFSSHGDRIAALVDAAHRAHRPVYLMGTSLISYGYVAGLRGVRRLSARDYSAYYGFPHNAVVLCTGAQAELSSILPRLIAGEFSTLTFTRRHDAVIIAASTIPKEEILSRVPEMVSDLAAQVTKLYLAPNVATASIGDPSNTERGPFHVSGHARREESRQVLEAVRPRLAIPVHGDAERRAMMRDLLPPGTELVLASECQEIEI